MLMIEILLYTSRLAKKGFERRFTPKQRLWLGIYTIGTAMILPSALFGWGVGYTYSIRMEKVVSGDVIQLIIVLTYAIMVIGLFHYSFIIKRLHKQ